METPSTEPVTTPAEPTPSAPSDAALVDRVAQLERDLQQTQQTLHQTQCRAQIHRALSGTSPIDADAVALVVESTLPQDGSVPDATAAARAVEELRRARPALFRTPAPARASAMPARVERPSTKVEDAAIQAARRGDRASLMHYLRLKRSA